MFRTQESVGCRFKSCSGHHARPSRDAHHARASLEAPAARRSPHARAGRGRSLPHPGIRNGARPSLRYVGRWGHARRRALCAALLLAVPATLVGSTASADLPATVPSPRFAAYSPVTSGAPCVPHDVAGVVNAIAWEEIERLGARGLPVCDVRWRFVPDGVGWWWSSVTGSTRCWACRRTTSGTWSSSSSTASGRPSVPRERRSRRR